MEAKRFVSGFNPQFLIVVAIPVLIFCWYLVQLIEFLKSNLPSWLACNWGWLVLAGLVICSPLYWKAYKKISKHREEMQDMRAYRTLLLAAAEQARRGANLEYHNSRTGDMLKLSPSDYEYEESTQVSEQLAVPDDVKQIAAPDQVVTMHLSDGYAIHADDFLSGRKLIVGVSGSGKSNTVGAYAEELGNLGVPFVLADTEDEYRPLCNPKWLRNGVLAGIDSVSVDNAGQFGAYVLSNQIQAILNLQSYEFEEAAQVMVGIIGGMREWQEARDNEHRIPSDFILEEAVTWLPQYVRESPLHGTDTLAQLQGTFFNDMVRKGRKRGLGLTLVCQKIAELDNRAMQSDGKLLHRQTEEADLERYRKMGVDRDETLSLSNGEAFLFTGRVSKKRIQIRRRHSPHGANTPGLSNLIRQQKEAGNVSVVVPFGNVETGLETDLETPPQANRNVIEGVFTSDQSATGPTTDKVFVSAVSSEKRETIKRMVGMKLPHRKIAQAVGLSGRNYDMYRQVCHEEGIAIGQAGEA